MGGYVAALAYYNAASNTIEDIAKVAAPGMQRIFSSDQFRATRKQRNIFVHDSRLNGTALCIWVANELLLFRLSCANFEEGNGVLQLHGMYSAFNKR